VWVLAGSGLLIIQLVHRGYSNSTMGYRISPMCKVKCTLVQALRLGTGHTAHRGSRGIALLFHDHGTRRGWGVSVTPRPLLCWNMPVLQVLDQFSFTTNQLHYSAYRAGVSVEMRPCPVTCHTIQCLEFSPPFFTLEEHCGSGFYIQS